MARMAVLIPGIMGSSLRYDDGTGQHRILWDKDFRTNYANLLRDPKLLAWTGKTAHACLLREAHAGWIYPKYKLWNRTIDFLDRHQDFQNAQLHFGYDWRQSLLGTADILCARLSTEIGDDVAKSSSNRSAPRFVMIAHSMGGVLVRVALGLQKLHPSWLDRLFVIGAPLRGAPQALHSLYGDISPLPLLVTLIRLLRGPNQQRFLEYFRECMQSFPSAYQLLPHIDCWYLYYGSNDRRNALQEGNIPEVHREHAREAHEATRGGAAILERAGIPVFCLFTKVHFQEQTELEYRVHPRPMGYAIDEVLARTDYGDGTVPMESARDTVTHATLLDLVSVTHATMCNDRKVVDRLRNHIG
jgi:hypothetical protein